MRGGEGIVSRKVTVINGPALFLKNVMVYRETWSLGAFADSTSYRAARWDGSFHGKRTIQHEIRTLHMCENVSP